jgi:PAS domain S-box-containing protein
MSSRAVAGDSAPQEAKSSCLAGGGEAGALLRARDWATHPLGPPPNWPMALQTTVRLLLGSKFPMLLLWGPALSTFYNDAYALTIGAKHPDGLGLSVHAWWPELAARRQATWDRALAGESVYVEDARYVLPEGGAQDEALARERFYTHCHSPVWGDTGQIEGIFLVATETTRRVLAEHDLTRSNAQLAEQVSALKSSEDQLRTLAQAMPNHVWTATPDGMLDWFNERVYQYSGASAGQLDGHGWARIVHPDDLPVVAAHWATAISAGATYETEFRLRQHDGIYRWHLVRAVPIHGSDGAITRWVGTNTDIEEQKATADSLVRLNETLEQQVAERTADRNRLWQLSADIMLVAQIGGTILAVNPAWQSTLGWTEQELVGRNIWDLAHPDDVEHVAQADVQLRAGQTLARFDQRYRHKDGSYRWITWSAVPGDGVVSAVGRDFTAEKEQAEALERSEARLRSVFETSYQYQGLLTTDGILLDANPASLAGIEAELMDVVGTPYWETPWFSGTPAVRDQVRAAVPLVASGQSVRQEIAVNLPTGMRIFDFAMRPVFNSSGEVIAIVPEAMELTERRLAEEQLRQSMKMEALGQLTGGIAHDFNNLLTGIIGSLALVRRRLDAGRTDDLGQYMDAASTGAQRAAALTHRLLAFARRQSLDTRAADINALVADLEDMLQRTLGETIALTADLDPDLWLALSDANQFENALLNLAINARDAMPGGGQLIIETRNLRISAAHGGIDIEPGEYVEVAVSDTGAGMPVAVLAKAFDPFFTTKPIGQGTGLGLSMIYGFVKQSGGHVRLDSVEGQGTTVRLYLRRATLDEADVPEDAPWGVPRGRGETVLVVEDDATIRLLIVDVLEDLGYRYVEAADARAAIPVLESADPIDLLVTDVGLPGMNGRQLAEIARQHRPDLKVLFVTGYAESASARSGFLGPGMEMMAKPFDLEALATKIRELLES